MRKFEERVFQILMILACTVIVGCFIAIIATIIVKALPGLDLDLVSRIPEGGFYIGSGGGILNAIIGSLYIAGGATILSFAVAIPIVIYLNVYLARESRLASAVRLSADLLFGLPSIIYGAFGFTILMALGLRASLLPGMLVITLVVLPLMIRTIDEMLARVPAELADASYSLGATPLEVGGVFLRHIGPGLFTAVILAFGRAIGDGAAVMFTAGFSDNIPRAFSDPAATLPLAIFFQLGSPVESVQSRAYAAALILTVIVLAASIMARIIGRRFNRHRIQ